MGSSFINIDVDLREFKRSTRILATRQMPFAAALALTRTGADIQKEIRRSLPDKFIVRRRQYLSRGIKLTRATKENLTATIYLQNREPFRLDFLTLQETGGTKTPKGRSLSLPTANVRRSPSSIIRGAKRPRQLLKQKDVFAGEVKGVAGIFRRPKRGARPGTKAARLKLLYAFERRVRIRKALGFVKTTEKMAVPRFRRHFPLALEEALAS